MGADFYTKLLGRHYAGRKWIIAADAAAGAAPLAQRILDAGASGVMIVAGSPGTGPPLPEQVATHVMGVTGTTMMDGIRAFADVIASPSDELCNAIERFDPDGQALLLSSHLIPTTEVCGRGVDGAPRPEWKALEDKMIIDELWDRAGVQRAPSRIVDPNIDSEVDGALREVSDGSGAVLVADNAEGWHGGGEYTRFLAPGVDRSETMSFFQEHSHRIRVTPFLEGVPCSIHGLVADGNVLAFRPVEVLVYRRPGSDEFVYAGTSTVWDPPEQVREEMRGAVRATGALISQEVGYRGAFGIDGVCTAEGFFPTELNPRLTVGLGMQAMSAGRYPIGDIDRAMISGRDEDLQLDELERELVAGADANRTGRWLRPIPHLSMSETIEQAISFDGSSWQPVADTDATASMALGPSAHGALLLGGLSDGHRLEPGPSIAHTVAASFAVADQIWDTRIGHLIPGTEAAAT